MELQTIIALILVGWVAGMLGGMVGVGGGIVIVPALVYFLGFSQIKAQGTSLALIMFPVGILGVIQYYQKGQVDFSAVILLAAGFIIGSFFGSKISLSLPMEIVKKIFAGVMILAACKMLFWDKSGDNKQKEKSTISRH